MIDPELVRRKIILILEDLRAVEPLGQKSTEEYLASNLDEVIAERYLERIIGRMIDVNYHLVTESGHPPPRDYFQSFFEIGRIGALPMPFAMRIASAAGLRNRLVHQYDDIDPRKVHQILAASLTDIREYLEHVEAYLQKSE